MGGEKPLGKVQQCVLLGSPPHGRGKVYQEPETPVPDGITPAWAGKSSVSPQGFSFLGDHPRVGGEKAQLVRTST